MVHCRVPLSRLSLSEWARGVETLSDWLTSRLNEDPSVTHAENLAAVELTIEPRIRPVGNGSVRRLLPYRQRRMVGPFTFLDIMGPEALGPGEGLNIDAHPHIGLSTLTYLLRGRAVHRDSTGAVQTIEPGAVNWMTAGSGVTHTERSHPDDLDIETDLFGTQLWVALPRDAENNPPKFEHCDAAEVPVVRSGDAEIRVAAGSGWGHDAPVAGSSPLVLADISLDGSTLAVPAEHPERAVLSLNGDLRVGGSELKEGSLAVLEPGTTAEISGRGTALLIGGEPVGKRYIWWNFVHSDLDAVEDAKRRWLGQSFPKVPDDHQTFVPLPSTPPAKSKGD